MQRVDSSSCDTIRLKGFEDVRDPVRGSVRTESAPLRRKAIRVFDNKVERASRENEMFGLKSERTHNLGLCPQRAEVVDLPRSTSGFKREFDPGSESTLAACLTHASRTRKGSNP